MTIIRVRGHSINLDINPSAIARRIEGFHALRERLIRESGGDTRRVDEFLIQRLAHAFEHFSTHYDGQVGGAIGRILEIRRDIAPLYDALLNGNIDHATSQRILRMFDELQRRMNELTSPSQHLDDAQAVDLPPARPHEPDPTRPRDPNEPPPRDPLVLRQDQALDALRDTDALGDASRQRTDWLRRREQELRASGNIWLADRYRALRMGIEAWTLRQGLRMRAFQLMSAVAESPYLRELAANGGLAMLREFWVAYHPRRFMLASENFEAYVRQRMTAVLGTLGEFDAPHRLSDRYDVLKGPDHNVTQRGTDLILVDRTNGDIMIGDNKANQFDASAPPSGRQITGVTALVENIVRNLRDDADQMMGILSQGDTPPVIRDAIGRFRQAASEVERFVNDPANAGLSEDDMQRAIRDILARHRIRRVVTNAFGNAADISKALRDIGIDFESLN